MHAMSSMSAMSKLFGRKEGDAKKNIYSPAYLTNPNMYASGAHLLSKVFADVGILRAPGSIACEEDMPRNAQVCPAAVKDLQSRIGATLGLGFGVW